MPLAFLRRRIVSGKDSRIIEDPIMGRRTIFRRKFSPRQIIRQGNRAHEPRLERKNNALHESRGRRFQPVKRRDGNSASTPHGEECVTHPFSGRLVDPTCQIPPHHNISSLKRTIVRKTAKGHSGRSLPWPATFS